MRHPPSTTTLATAGCGLLVTLLYLSPVLRDVLRTGLDWPIWVHHHEAVALTTYGQWSVKPPYHYLTDGSSGEFPTYYQSLSDTLINLAAELGHWPAMTVQAVIYGPLLGFLFLWLNYLSLASVLRQGRVALGASLIISLGGNSGLTRWIDPAWDHALSFRLHVPFHALSLGTGQSLGWVLFLPSLALMYRAYREFTIPRAVAAGTCLGLLLHTHTLTLVNVAFVQLLYLIVVNALERPRDRRWGIWAASLGLVAAIFLGAVTTRPAVTFATLVVIALAAFLATFLFDPGKRFYLWSYGTALVVAAPYVLSLARHARAFLAVQDAWVQRAGVGVGELFLFFAAYVPAAVLAYAAGRDRPVLIWVSAMLAGTFFLAFNQVWRWDNHPYRFAIHLIFPLGILAALGLRGGPPRLTVPLSAWIVVVLLGNSWSFLTGDRIWVNFRVGTPEQAAFLGRVRAATAAFEGTGLRILTSPEIDYPRGVFQTAVLMNYSRIPAFVPDYRHLLWPERYYNRMGLFCFLFPGFPNTDLPFGRHACDEALDPDPEVLEILDPRLKTSILPVYSIALAGATGKPFARFLAQTHADYGWPVLAENESQELLRTEVTPLPGVARLGHGRYGPDGLDLEFEVTEPGPQIVILGGRGLADRARLLEIDGHELGGALRLGNWARGRVDLPAGPHRLHLAWHKPDYVLESDYLYFAGVIQEGGAGRYLRLRSPG
jgi:hypothetical protein